MCDTPEISRRGRTVLRRGEEGGNLIVHHLLTAPILRNVSVVALCHFRPGYESLPSSSQLSSIPLMTRIMHVGYLLTLLEGVDCPFTPDSSRIIGGC